MDTWFISMPIRMGRSKNMYLMPLLGKFSLHHLDYGDNTICIGEECVGEKTNFHESSIPNTHIISLELISYYIKFKALSHS
jgi:hypothetical protein